MQKTQEMQVQSLDGEDPPGRTWQLTSLYCLENPIDRGAWWATGHMITTEVT